MDCQSKGSSVGEVLSLDGMVKLSKGVNERNRSEVPNSLTKRKKDHTRAMGALFRGPENGEKA